MQEKLRRAEPPKPRVIGIDQLSIRKGHSYRIVVSDLEQKRVIWFGGIDRSQQSMDGFYEWLTPNYAKFGLPSWTCGSPLRASTHRCMPLWQAFCMTSSTYFSHLNDALDTVRRSEYHRASQPNHKKFIKGQRYTLLSAAENLKSRRPRSP